MGSFIFSSLGGGRVSKNYLGSWNSCDLIWTSNNSISFSNLSTTKPRKQYLFSSVSWSDFKLRNNDVKKIWSIWNFAISSLKINNISLDNGFATYPIVGDYHQRSENWILWQWSRSSRSWTLESSGRWFQPSYVSDCCPPSAIKSATWMIFRGEYLSPLPQYGCHYVRA